MAPLKAVKRELIIEYRVGKHNPGLHTYPLWARWMIRFVYFVTGYQVTAQDVGIASTPEEADAMCLDPSYFYKPLYVDYPLAPEQCAPGPVVWPRSEANGVYQRLYPDSVLMTRQQFDALASAVDRVARV